MRKKSRGYYSEFTVLGVFVAVAMLGFAYAGMSLVFGSFGAAPLSQAVTVVAPTVGEYQAEAAAVLAPFILQSRTMTAEEIAAAGPDLTALVGKVEDRLLGMRVPREMRDAHLSFVLLMEQWKRAAEGERADQISVPVRTQEVVAAQPWLLNGTDRL